MLERTYLAMMDAPHLDSTLAAQDAATALIALGWPVSPSDDDPDTRRLGYFVMTGDELIDFALRWGIRPAAETVQ